MLGIPILQKGVFSSCNHNKMPLYSLSRLLRYISVRPVRLRGATGRKRNLFAIALIQIQTIELVFHTGGFWPCEV